MANYFGRRYASGYFLLGENNPHGTTDISEITSSGWYSIITPAGMCHTFIECDFEEDKNWILVLANRGSTGGMNNLRWNDAIKKVNIRTGGSDQGYNTHLNSIKEINGLKDYNVWVGLDFWKFLGKRKDTNKITVCQYVSNNNGTRLKEVASHLKRAMWTFDEFNDAYAFQNVEKLKDDTNTGYPDMCDHALDSIGLSTFDKDIDKCKNNNNPFWNSSANWFSGGEYKDTPYWNSTDRGYQYGGTYIC